LYSHSLLSLPRYGDHRDLHSFPTRRSSDLQRSRRGDDHAGQYVCQVPDQREGGRTQEGVEGELAPDPVAQLGPELHDHSGRGCPDRKSTRLNSSHVKISYAVFCLKKKKETT